MASKVDSDVAQVYRHMAPARFAGLSDDEVIGVAKQLDPKFEGRYKLVAGQAPQQAQTLHPVVDAFNKGFMGQELPEGAGGIERVAHEAGSIGLPALGGAGGSIAGPAGAIAGAMAGKAVQKVAQQVLGRLAPEAYGQASNEDPLQVGSDVAKTGLGQAAGEGLGAGVSKVGEFVADSTPTVLSKLTKIPQKDIEYAIKNAADVFSGKSKEEIGQIYREGITSNSQEMLPGFANAEQQAQPLKHFINDYVDRTGETVLSKADEASVAKASADMAIKAVKNGGKVVADTGESRTLTPQEAFNGLQAINYFKYNKEGAVGKFAGKINQDSYENLVKYLEDNGYPAIRDSLLTWKEGATANKFSSLAPLTKKGDPDLVRLAVGAGLGTHMLFGHNPKASVAELALLAGSSPWLVGQGIKYGSPALGALTPLMKQALPGANSIVGQTLADLTNKAVKKYEGK